MIVTRDPNSDHRLARTTVVSTFRKGSVATPAPERRTIKVSVPYHAPLISTLAPSNDGNRDN